MDVTVSTAVLVAGLMLLALLGLGKITRFRWSASVRVGKRRRRKLVPGVALLLGWSKTWRFGHRPRRRRSYR